MGRSVAAASLCALIGVSAFRPPQPANRAASLDAAFARYWAAKDPSDAAKVSADIVNSGASFDDVYARLKRGRAYSKDVPTGVVAGKRRQFEYTLDIPPSYDPARQYQVRIQLHGGVMRPAASPRGRGGNRLAGAEQIYVAPVGWSEAPWWSDAQLENLRAILDTVKRTYNVDENHVAVAGISDGGTGAYYVAMRDTTPYSSFLPLNGYILVLRSPELDAGDLFINNLRNKPLFIVNGGKDPLYPIDLVEPSIVHMNRGGVGIVYRPQKDAGHDTSWWPSLKEEFEAFVRDQPRKPLPDRLTWETSETRSWNRAHWLVIEALGTTPGDAKDMPDLNRSQGYPVFRNGRSGRVDLTRSGNTISAATRGVKEFTLLLSPDQFDFSTKIKVVVNGSVSFDDKVEKSVATLMKWAARDNDRTMLFGAEIRIRP